MEYAAQILVLSPDALPEEGGELADKPRLKFRFDRRSFGRMRQLLDIVNAEGLSE